MLVVASLLRDGGLQEKPVITEKKVSEIRNFAHGNIERLACLEKEIASKPNVSVKEQIENELKKQEILERLVKRYDTLYTNMIEMLEVKRSVETKQKKIDDVTLQGLKSENRRMKNEISAKSRAIADIWSELL